MGVEKLDKEKITKFLMNIIIFGNDDVTDEIYRKAE